MAEILPWRGVSDVRVFNGGSVLPSWERTLAMSDTERYAPRGASKAGSKMSPGMKAGGKVSGVDLNSSCP